MDEWLGLGILFAGVLVVSFGLIQWAAVRGQRLRQRLRKEQEESDEYVLGGLTPALAGQFPPGKEKEAELQAELRAAGIYRPTALMEFAAIRAVFILLPLLLAGALAALAPEEYVPRIAIAGLVGAVLGYSLPRIYLHYLAVGRKRRIEKGLPVAVDLLSLGLLSGQNVMTTLQRVSREVRFAHPELADELTIVREQAQLNTLPHALEQWARRANIPEVNHLVAILSQGQTQGADVASGLFEFATNFRASLRQRADTQANRAGFWMIFPTVFCLLTAAMIVLVGPVYFQFVTRGTETTDQVAPAQEANEKLRRMKARMINRAGGGPAQPAPPAGQ